MAFAATMLLVLADRADSLWVPALLGFAILGKGLAPLALFLPAVWFLRRQPKTVAITLFGAILVALPWYWLVTFRNGSAFLYDFFWKHHVLRFATGALQHVRPFWFFAPVLLAGMFPWTPVLALLFRRSMYRDRRIQLLAAWALFGLVFFSASRNKLPGYILPIVPAVAALCGIALAETRRATVVLAACAGLLWLVPAIQQALPHALIAGLGRTPVQWPYEALIPVGALAVLCWILESRGQRGWAVAVVTAGVTASVISVVWITYPVLDNTVSARRFYKVQGSSMACTPSPNRSWRYGLDYYAHRPIPDCK